MRTCTIEGCDKKHSSKGLCRKHYDAGRYVNGYVNGSYVPVTIAERFDRNMWSKYKIDTHDWAIMWNEQHGVCGNVACHVKMKFKRSESETDSACVHHDHDTGEVLGLWCRACNTAEGHINKIGKKRTESILKFNEERNHVG